MVCYIILYYIILYYIILYYIILYYIILYYIILYYISIYTLSDLGDLSNLIGSLSRTIQQYSPPSEWIMCELRVFPIFYRTIF